MDIHVVRPGDTLYSIAQQYGVSMAIHPTRHGYP